MMKAIRALPWMILWSNLQQNKNIYPSIYFKPQSCIYDSSKVLILFSKGTEISIFTLNPFTSKLRKYD